MAELPRAALIDIARANQSLVGVANSLVRTAMKSDDTKLEASQIKEWVDSLVEIARRINVAVEQAH